MSLRIHVPHAKGRVYWSQSKEFVEWFRSVAPHKSSREMIPLIKEVTGLRAITLGQVTKLRETWNINLTSEAVQQSYKKRAEMIARARNATLKHLRLLGPDDAEFFVKVTGDCIVTSDWHVPYHHQELVEKMCEVAEALKIKQLIIGGDFLNEDAFSRWKHHPFNIEWAVEKEMARALLEDLCKSFKSIFYLLDNHDRRILATHERSAEFTERDFIELLVQGTIRRQIRASLYYHYTIVNETWRVTAPKEYRRVKLTLPNRLAQVYHQHIIATGDHLFGLGFDDSGEHVIANAMSMVNAQEVPYVQTQDTTYPKWQNGFWVIKANKLIPFVNHPLLWPEWWKKP